MQSLTDPRIEDLSPFLPGTYIQYAIDSTSLGWFKTCPRLYQYHMIDGWSHLETPIHLRFGIEYHQALHDYEKAKAKQLKHLVALRETVRALLIRIKDWKPIPLKDSEKLKTPWNLLRTVVWYLEKFRDDPAETLILKDGTPAMEVNFKFELDFGPQVFTGRINKADNVPIYDMPQPYLLCGHLDRIVTFGDAPFVMDRKTSTSTLGSYYFDQYAPDNQMTIYSFAGQVVMDAPIKGVIIDAAQIMVDASRFVRGFTMRTSDQIEEWLKDLRWWLSQMEACAVAKYWPQNDTACNKFGGCRFRDICSKSPQVRDKFLETSFEKGPQWNPLVPRE